MPLETATYISDLIPANPAHSDGLSQADAHLRLLKNTLQDTFPNIAGEVTASHSQLNSLLSQLLGTTAYTAPLGTVGAPSYAFVGDTDTGWYSPGANRAALSLGGVDALNFASDKKATFAAGAAFGGPITGPGSMPIGGMCMWLSDVLPLASAAGTYCWANGGTLSRTVAGSGKELYDEWSRSGGDPLRYGIGDGSTTFNVINMQEAVPVGKSTMGGAASPGLLTTISAGLKAALGGLFGQQQKALVRSDLPNVAPTFTGTAGTVNVSGSVTAARVSNVFNTGTSPNPCIYGADQSNAFTATGSFTPAGTVESLNGNVTQTALQTVQPSRAVNFIIRIA